MSKALILAAAIALSGCSGAAGVLSGVIGSQPDVTAQVGQENTKQTVGVTAKQDTSSKQETTFKESKVDKVDTSNKKSVSASSIQAENINAERIEIRNGGDDWKVVMIIACFSFLIGSYIGYRIAKRKGA